MKLTETQIQDLYKFTRQHYVEYYDLQTELVDHLANDIETIWKEHPNLSLEAARDQSFKKFGVFGFMDVISRHQKTMHKQYIKYLWQYLKEWFKFPQLITTLTIFLGFYTLFSLEFSYYIFIGLLVTICFATFYKGWILKKEAKKRKEESSKKWLLKEIIFQQASGGIGVFYLNIFNFHILHKWIFLNQITIIVTSILFTLTMFLIYINYWVFPKEAEKLLNETYPEYKLAK